MVSVLVLAFCKYAITALIPLIIGCAPYIVQYLTARENTKQNKKTQEEETKRVLITEILQYEREIIKAESEKDLLKLKMGYCDESGMPPPASPKKQEPNIVNFANSKKQHKTEK